MATLDPVKLGQALRQAIDQTIHDVLAQFVPVGTGTNVMVESGGEGSGWEFPWPDGKETYKYSDFNVAGDLGGVTLRIGRTTRPAYAKEDRGRVVVFGPIRKGSSQWHPWVEFTETDTDEFAAVVPNPAKPRKILRDGDVLQPRFAGRDVRRADQVFNSIGDGPSLRLVVAEDDNDSILDHAYYMATLKGRL